MEAKALARATLDLANVQVLIAAAQALIGALTLVGLYYSRKASVTASDTLRYSQSVTEKELRAYIHIFEMNVPSFEVGQRARVSFQLKNSGQTPATNVHIRTKVSFVKDVEEIDAIEFREVPDTIPRSIMGSGQCRVIDRNLGRMITEELLEQIRRRQIFFTLHGWVEYEDIFGISRKTQYQLFWNHRVKRMQYTQTGNVML